jgi:hypothetical protein
MLFAPRMEVAPPLASVGRELRARELAMTQTARERIVERR